MGVDPDAPKPAPWSWPRFWRNAGLIAAVVTVATWYAIEGVVPNLAPKNFGVVEPGAVYRSGVLTPAAMAEVVREHGIRTVIDFGAHEAGTPADLREVATARALGIEHVRLPLYGDGAGDPNMYADALRIMRDPARRPVLVHCSAGAERTGAAVTLYRHIEQGVPLDQAYAECADHNHDPERNSRLRAVLDHWHNEVARSLATGERIEYDGPSPP